MNSIDKLVAAATDYQGWLDNVKGTRPAERGMRAEPMAVLEVCTAAKRYALLRELMCSDNGEEFLRVINLTPFEAEVPTPEGIDAALDAELVRRAADAGVDQVTADMITVPVVLDFKSQQRIGEMRIRQSQLPAEANFVFALGVMLHKPTDQPGTIPKTWPAGPYTLEQVALVSDDSYIGYLHQIGKLPSALHAVAADIKPISDRTTVLEVAHTELPPGEAPAAAETPLAAEDVA